MQRQSLGSPSSSIHPHGGARGMDKEEKRKSGISPSAELAASTSAVDVKTEKPIRAQSKSDSSVHFVPILVLLCFVILYLCSQEPSAEDLATFVGFSSLINHKDMIAAISVAEKIGGLGLRSHRALKETGRVRNRRLGPP